MPQRVGVVIRTLNESLWIERCLETLRCQQPGFDLDIVVVDSGSSDETVAKAQALGARVVHLPPEEFDYSTALNLGIAEVQCELVVLLSAHAIPVDDKWLAKMIAPFDDPRVAGVNCRQMPWADAPWHEVKRIAETFPRETLRFTPRNSDQTRFSNAASCIRRDVWCEHTFVLPIAEDLEWARQVVAANWVVVYVAEAAVYHSHNDSPHDQAQRLIDFNRVIAGGDERTVARTLREAARLLVSDGGAILRLDDAPRRKAAHLRELLTMIRYYVSDFSRPGTTAERRREDVRGTVTGRAAA